MTLFFCLLAAAAIYAAPADSCAVVSIPDATSLIRPEFRLLARKLAVEPCCVPTCANQIECIHEGKDYKENLINDIQAAGHLVELEVFLFGNDPDGASVRDLLFDKVRQGLEVRYIHDSYGNFFDSIFDGRKVFTGYYDEMSRRGIKIHDVSAPWRPDPIYIYPAQRNHRKINILDKQIAYTGGMNITEGSMSGWNDSMLRITGPAVSSLRGVFLENWNYFAGKKSERDNTLLQPVPASDSTGVILQIVPDGPDMPANMAEEFIVWALDNAKSYVWFQTPYFGPTPPVLKALKRAGERGLDVRILIPLEADIALTEPVARSFFKTCTDSGVKLIYRTGPFNHTKSFVCDDYLTCIGSTNLDGLSLKRLYEVNVLIYDEQTALDNRAHFLESAEEGCPIDEELYKTWDGKEKFLQGLLRPASPWL